VTHADNLPPQIEEAGGFFIYPETFFLDVVDCNTTRYYQWQRHYTRSDLATGIRFQLGLIWNIF
jgi:hypothetical protein